MVVHAQQDVDGARAAAQRVVQVHESLVEFLRAGLTLAEIDRFVAERLYALDCKSAFLRYKIRAHPPFPSHSCLSVNDCIVHGTHDMTADALTPGDIISVDIGVKHRGWIGDAAWTYAVEHADDEAQRLMTCGRETLRRGIASMQPGKPLIEWARAIQPYVEAQGFHLVRNLGGHGYGKKLHGPPFISNTIPRHRGDWPDAWLTYDPGMLIAVEPMIAAGTPDTGAQPRKWPIHTADGSLSVHYEADVLITPNGPDNLTEGMDDLPDIVG